MGGVTIDSALYTGSSQRLPTLVVSNPGDVGSDFTMSIRAIEGRGRPIPEDWVTFVPDHFRLAPGGIQAVEVRLTIPDHAALGRYEGMLAAQIVLADREHNGAGVGLGAGAAARLEFEVAAPTALQTAWAHFRSVWNRVGIWGWVGLGSAVTLLTVRWLRKRFRFSIVRK
jgi:hypothetical protein